MEGFRVPKRGLQVRVLLEGRQEFIGQLYVPETGPYGGPGRLSDRLNNEDEDFMPLSCGESGVFLICKSRIIFIEVDVNQEEPEPMDVADRNIEIRIDTIDGHAISGRISYMMPPGQRRTLDFLNAAPAFIPLLGAGKITHVRRASVTRVRELSEGASEE
ncbi:MAG: hypothetical protein JXO72_15270 [Vicinamibacteria bacterium]|nr:hypothetical protein [Vicinamibacteria bacterium]